MPTTVEEMNLAKWRFEQGQLTSAEGTFRAIVEQDAGNAEAWNYLGIIAQRLGNRSLAIDYYEKAATALGFNAAVWNNLGVACATNSDYGKAANAFRKAIELAPAYADPWNNLGIVMQYQGNLAEAIHCFKRALELHPAFAPHFNNMGYALKAMGKFAEAREYLEKAIQLKPDYFEAINNLGTTLHEDGELEKAIVCYRQALQLVPGYADASNNLATALKEQGHLDEAIAQYRHTLKMKPDHVLAYYNLSQFAAEGLYTFAPEELERIKGLLASGRCNDLEHSLFCFTLGAVLDKEGAFDEAFHYYQQANDRRQRHLQARNQAFHADQHRAFVDRIIAVFDQAYFERVKQWGIDAEMPIFIFGMPRSGTSLVEQILASHPLVFGAGELGEIPRLLYRGERSLNDCAPPFSNQEEARRIADVFLARIAKIGRGAPRVASKTLENYMHLGVIAALFPRARLVHCRRNTMDVCLSCYFQNFQDMIFSWSMEDIADYYGPYEKLMAHWQKVLPVPFLEVRYEDIIKNQEAISRKLVDFCGLTWDDRCLQFFKSPRVVRTASTIQVRKPIYDKSLNRWKNYRAHLGPLLKALDRVASSGVLPEDWRGTPFDNVLNNG